MLSFELYNEWVVVVVVVVVACCADILEVGADAAVAAAGMENVAVAVAADTARLRHDEIVAAALVETYYYLHAADDARREFPWRLHVQKRIDHSLHQPHFLMLLLCRPLGKTPSRRLQSRPWSDGPREASCASQIH